MASRLFLQTKLEELLGSRNVYYQPPASVAMRYPAIVYSRKPPNILYANDAKYKHMAAYEVTLIDEDPDSEYYDKILQLPYCSFNRFFTSDNLNHFVFTLYY